MPEPHSALCSAGGLLMERAEIDCIHELRCRGMSLISFQAIPMGAPDWCDLYIQQTPDLGAND